MQPLAALAASMVLPVVSAAGSTAANARLNRDAIILSIIIILILMAVVVFLVWWVGRKRRVFLDRQRALYQAGRHTLSVADGLAAEVSETRGKLSKSSQRDFDRAASLRAHAAATLDHAGTDTRLAAGNREAAEAVLILGQLRIKVGIDTSAPPARCFYCGREDGAFQEVRIGADSAARLTVQICSECAKVAESGDRPRLRVEPYHNTQVPWWAIPNNLWYAAYGGEAWQYWLPIVTGQTIEAWFAGGWAQEAPDLPTASA